EVLTPEDPAATPEVRAGVAVFDFTPMDDGLQGYYWDFPSFIKGKAYMNRGVFDSRARPEKPKADLKEILAGEMAERDRRLARSEFVALQGTRVLLVGDAAGADPLMGEGISFALGYGDPAAATIIDAFARDDFSFDSYRERLAAHPLFRQLDLRVRLARYAYLLNRSWVAGLGWRVMRLEMRFTSWNDRSHVPIREPEFSLIGANLKDGEYSR
nr:hypothetical protein [Promineifilum sp.]